MCSINEDTNVPPMEIPSINPEKLKNAQCRRCQEAKAQVLLRKTDPYCRNCFMSYAIHKFRSTIGKFRAVRPNELVLVAYSGGLSSGSMLKMVQQGLEEAGAQKRLTFKPSVLYIDEGILFDLTHEERLANIHLAQRIATNCNLEIYTTSLEYSLAKSADDVQLYKDFKFEPSPFSEQIKFLFESVKSLTAKEDLLQRLKQSLMVLCATKLGYKKIFLGSTATRLAGQLLTAVAQGRGAQIADEIGFSDTRTPVEFVRPMREFVDKEVAYLARYLQVDSLSVVTLTSKLRINASINRLTEEFVVKLQNDFPATISTLFRTGDKLKSVVTRNTSEIDDSCAMCRSRIEAMPLCGAYTARTFSHSVSRKGPHQFEIRVDENDTDCDGSDKDDCQKGCEKGSKLTGCCKEVHSLPPNEEWIGFLCYGCRVTFQDVLKPEFLPESVKDEVVQRTRRQRMKESVQQFLL